VRGIVTRALPRTRDLAAYDRFFIWLVDDGFSGQKFQPPVVSEAKPPG
jgi:hypothetical protein